jgi:hypothetical protein
MIQHPQALPDHALAVLDPNKLTGYALSTSHPTGQHNARVFASALGYTMANWMDLEKAIHIGLPHYPATANPKPPYGCAFTVDMPLTGPAGSAVVRTAWLIHNGLQAPHLTTLYVL